MTEDHKARVKRARRSIKYSHGFDKETLLELKHKSNLSLVRSLDGNLYNANYTQRRILKREGIIKQINTRKGYRRLEWTELGEKLLRELEEEKVGGC